MTMNILITGNMGYVGPALVRIARAELPDARLVGLDTGFFGHCLTGARSLPESLLDRQIFKDVRDVTADDLAGVDAVIHLAALSNDPIGKAYESLTAEINHRASVDIATMAKRAGARRFVFASSCSVYGFAEGGPRDESSELNPLTAYARSKIATERDVEGLADRDFVVTCLRFPTACGMSDRLRLDLVLNDFVAAAVASGRIEILSDGTPWRPLIDIKDMSRAMLWAIGRDPGAGGEFLSVNVGRTEWNYQIKDLAEAVRAEMPQVEVSINENAAPDKRSYQVDFSRFRALAPDHQPRVPLEQSIRELRAGLEGMGFNNHDFRNSDFMRLKVLISLCEHRRLDPDLHWLAA
jgi:nucleoside-diphosphate-sugar epimerase